MPEPNEVAELQTLRQTVAELTTKNATRKKRIAELETQLATAQANTVTAQATLHDIEVTRPMQTLSEAISPTPELWLSELARVGYKIAKQDNKLVVMFGNKAVDGVDVTVDGLKKLLLTNDAKHKNFVHLITASRASGGGANGASTTGASRTAEQSAETKPNKPHFGLR